MEARIITRIALELFFTSVLVFGPCFWRSFACLALVFEQTIVLEVFGYMHPWHKDTFGSPGLKFEFGFN